MTEVRWPGRRQDVVAALEALTTLTPEDLSQWPDLDSAVHWLVDDTWWDQRSPSEDVGLVLADQAEAEAVTAVLGPLLALLDELGPAAPDVDCLRHPLWRDVVAAAGAALEVLGRQQPPTARERQVPDQP